ncbi:MAG TPA: glycosyltransferase [Stellaceae bacterium]|nr:glycosyltransferase [Stellaceae bacterium]
MKIILLCQSLVVGGTQRQVALLAPALKLRGHDVSVAVFYGGGPFASAVAASGITIHDLKKNGRWDVFGFLLRLRRLMVRERADVLYAFLPVANIVSAIVKQFVRPAPRVVFGVRSARMVTAEYDWLTGLQYRVETLFSGVADGVIVNSRNGLSDIASRGFRGVPAAAIPNGIDTERFAPDPVARTRVRGEWGVQENETLVGHIARFDPMKGHHIFFAAAQQLANDRSWRFVCIGIDDDKIPQARALAEQFGVAQRVIFAKTRADMGACINAFDIVCQASRFGEGFPNAVAEAMACGVPCVVTDVGDAGVIVGDLGAIVPPGDVAALAKGFVDLRERLEAGSIRAADLRRSIVERFGVESIAVATERALQTIVG